MDSIAAATPATLDAWRRTLYAPQSLVISAAGAVDIDELLAFAERDFGAAATGAPEVHAPAAQFTGGVRKMSKSLEQANVVFLLPAVGARHPDYFALRLFAEILGGGMASRLFQEAREKRGLAYAIDAYSDTYADGGLLGVFAGCAAKDAAELAQVAAHEIANLARTLTDPELRRAKAQLKGSMFMARESPASRAEQAAAQTLLFGHAFSSREVAAEIDAVTPEDLARLSETLLTPAASAVAVLGPRTSLKAAVAFDRELFARA